MDVFEKKKKKKKEKEYRSTMILEAKAMWHVTLFFMNRQ